MQSYHLIAPGRTFIWAVTGLLQMNILCLAAAEVTSAGQQEKNQRMLQQKMALVERMLYQSPLGEQVARQPSELSPAVRDAWESARQAFAMAVESLANKRDKSADEALDSALSFYRAAAVLNRGVKVENVDFASMLSVSKVRIGGYRQAMGRIAKEKHTEVSARVDDQMVKEVLVKAETLVKQGDTEAAFRVLQAFQSVMEEELVLMRSGETLITKLEFDTPEDALEYEMNKSSSNERLLELLTRNHPLSESKNMLLSQYLQQSREASSKAMQYREAGDTEAALRTLESGTDAQTKALKIFGVNL